MRPRRRDSQHGLDLARFDIAVGIRRSREEVADLERRGIRYDQLLEFLLNQPDELKQQQQFETENAARIQEVWRSLSLPGEPQVLRGTERWSERCVELLWPRDTSGELVG